MASPESRASWTIAQELLASVDDECRRLNAELLLAIFPHTLQVDDRHVAFFAELGLGVDNGAREAGVPQRRLGAFCEARGIDCLDLLPSFRIHASGGLYRPRDDHLNDAGDRLAAAEIVDFLETHSEVGRGAGP